MSADNQRPVGGPASDMWPLLEWAALALLLPVILLMRPAWAPALLLLPTLWLLRWRRDGRPFPATPLDPALLLLLLMVLVTTLITPDLPHSLPKVAGLLYGITLFYAVVDGIGRHRAWLWYAAVALALGGSLIVLVGLLAGRGQLFVALPAGGGLGALGDGINALPGVPAVGVNPNEVAGIITWLLPWLAALGVAAWRRRAWGAFLVTAGPAALLGVALFLTGSRGAWLGVGVALLILAALHARHRPRLLLAGGAAVGLLLVIALAAAGPTALADALVAGGPGEGLSRTLRGRQELWSRAWYVMQDFSLTGVGLNNFRRVVPLLYPLFLTPPAVDFGHAHNLWLHTGAELGVPGLVAWTAVYLGAGWLSLRAWRQALSPWRRALAAGLGLSLVAFLLFGLTDAVALGARPGFLLWLLLALVAALDREERAAPPNSTSPTTGTSHR